MAAPTPFKINLHAQRIEFQAQAREELVRRCKTYIRSLHCTLWRDWLVTEEKGLKDASEWLADTMMIILSPTKKSG